VTEPGDAAHPQPEPPRRGRTNPLVVVAVLVAAMAFYFVLIGYRGVYLLGQDRWVLKVLGAAVLVLPVVGCWVVIAELRFGLASQRLERRMREAGQSTS
jgi:small-conductance mechanosensitive channel